MAKSRSKKTVNKTSVDSSPTLDFDTSPNSKQSVKKKEKSSGELFGEKIEEVIGSGAIIDARFDPSSDIFLEIHKGNIFHYFSSGAIAPAKYYKHRAFLDPQSQNQNSLVLANGRFSESDHDQVLLQVELYELEKSKLHVDGGVAYLTSVLPITRITKVLVSSENSRKSIINDALLFNGGFIPEKLVSVKKEIARVSIHSVQGLIGKELDLSSDFRRYDQMLGLFAFLRNYHLLVADRTNIYKTLPDHFILAMQSIEPKFASNILPNHSISDFYSFLFAQNTPPDKHLLKWIFERIGTDENFHNDDISEFQNVLFSVKDEENQEDYMKLILDSLKQSLERKSILSKVETFKSKATLPIYLFSFLRNYGNLNAIEVARKDIENVFSSNYGEYAFALLGYFYGYFNLRNSDERITSANPAIRFLQMNEKKHPIKFQLESSFDRTVIDLVYQKIFGGKDNPVSNLEGRFNAETTFVVAGNYTLHERSFSLIDIEYKRIEIKVEAKNDMRKEKEHKNDVNSDFAQVPEQIPYLSDLGVLCRRLGLRETLALKVRDNILTCSLTEINNNSYYLKSDLLKKLKESKQTISEEELSLRLRLTKISKGQ